MQRIRHFPDEMLTITRRGLSRLASLRFGYVGKANLRVGFRWRLLRWIGRVRKAFRRMARLWRPSWHISFASGPSIKSAVFVACVTMPLHAACSDPDFRFGSEGRSQDPFTVEGYLGYLISHLANGCEEDVYLRNVPDFSLDGNPSEFNDSDVIYKDASGDSSADTDRERIYVAYSSKDGGALLFLARMAAAPSTSHTLELGPEIAVFDDGFSLKVNARTSPDPGCQNQSGLAVSSSSGYEIRIPFSCLNQTETGNLVYSERKNARLQIRDSSSLNNVADYVELRPNKCIYWSY